VKKGDKREKREKPSGAYIKYLLNIFPVRYLEEGVFILTTTG